MALALKGRAASPVRPGLIVKGLLSAEIPLETGEYVHEASISELFRGYKAEVDRINATRPKDKHIRGMRRHSFYTMFNHAHSIGLVEYLRDEPWEYVPEGSELLRIEKRDGEAEVRVSTRKIFRLSALGAVDERCWLDITRAYKERWTCGQPAEYIPPTQVPPTPPVPPKPKVPKPPVEKPAGFESMKLPETPSIAKFRTLLKHLYTLKSLGLNFPGVADETSHLSMSLGDWIIDTEDNLEEAKSINDERYISMYGARLEDLNALSEVLDEGDLDRAIEILNGLIKRESK